MGFNLGKQLKGKMKTIYKMIRSGRVELESLEDLLQQKSLGTCGRIMLWQAMTSSTTAF